MDLVFLDFRCAVRSLRRAWVFTSVAVLSVAVGVAAAALALTLIRDAFYRPLPYVDPDRLVRLLVTASPGRSDPDAFSLGTYKSWDARAIRSLLPLAIHRGTMVRVGGAADSSFLPAELVSGTVFKTLGPKPLIGRVVDTTDAVAGAQPVVVVSHRFWQRHFNSSLAALGRPLDIDGVAHVVIGVMPPRFAFPARTELWVPISSPITPARPTEPVYEALSRLQQGATVSDALAEMNLIVGRSAEGDYRTGARPTANVTTLASNARRRIGGQLWIFVAASGVALLVACLNVAALYFGRSRDRARELGVRTALGATRWHLTRSLLLEGTLLAIVGGALGLLLAVWAGQLITGVFVSQLRLPFEIDVTPATALVAVAGGVAVAAGLSAIAILIGSEARLQRSLSADARATTATRSWRIAQRMFVVGQMSLALVLVVASGALIRSYVNLSRLNLGYDASDLVVSRVQLRGSDFADRDQRRHLSVSVASVLSTAHGVTATAVWEVIATPFQEPNAPPITVSGSAASIRASAAPLRTYYVTREFFKAAGIRTIGGRTFTDEDNASSPEVAVVNEEAVRRWFRGASPLGMQFKVGPPESATPWLTVVGVVANTQPVDDAGLWIGRSMGAAFFPLIYRPIDQPLPPPEARVGNRLGDAFVGVRAESNHRSIGAHMQQAFRQLAPELVTRPPATLRDVMLGEWPFSMTVFNTWLVGGMAVTSLLLACAGVYGAVAESVRRRTREIAIRIALGARGVAIRGLVLAEALTLGAIGIALGLIFIVGASRAVDVAFFGISDRNRAGFLFNASAKDPLILTIAAVSLLAVVVVASWWPASRAASSDPAETLRAE